jgi:hypothetical protein
VYKRNLIYIPLSRLTYHIIIGLSIKLKIEKMLKDNERNTYKKGLETKDKHGECIS